MNFFSLAVNNIKKKFGTYLIYLVSTTFAVTIFSIFCSIYYNPQFSAYRYGTGRISVLFMAAGIAIIAFALIFVMYSNTIFVKTRKMEIAIYSLMGMKKSQIGRMMFYENIIMGMIATAGGTILGVVFSRFFSMILLRLMADGTKVTFTVSWEVPLITVSVFLMLFTISSLNAYRTIYRYRLVELLAASRKGEKNPGYSVVGGILSVGLIILGYGIAMVMDVNTGGMKLMLSSLAVLVCVVTGTFLFFTNFVPMAMVAIRKRPALYYKPENIISISQITHRIRANSRMLSVIAITCAVAITMMSSTYSMYKTLEGTVRYYAPFSYLCKNTDDQTLEAMLAVIRQTGEVNVSASDQFELIKVQLQNDQYALETEKNPGLIVDGYIISQSTYESIIRDTKTEEGSFSNIKTDFKMDLTDNTCYFLDGNVKKDYCENLTGTRMNLQVGDQSASFAITGVSLHKYIGFMDLYQQPTIVLSDAAFGQYRQQAAPEAVVRYTGIMFDNPAGSEKTVAALNQIVPENPTSSAAMGLANLSYIGVYKSIFSMYGVLVFIGFFIGILFLLASGSIMYYKQIIEAQEEANRYDILRKLGMNRTEARKSIARQVGIVFLLSLAVGLVHSVFALLTYNRAMDLGGQELPTMQNAAVVMVIYLVIYCFFYLLSVASYAHLAWGREK